MAVSRSIDVGPARASGRHRVGLWLRWAGRDVVGRVWRWSSLPVVLVLAVPELTWAWDPLLHEDSPIQGGLGLISRAEGLWTVVVLAAAVPASIVVSDRRDGLVLLLRLRGLGPASYLALRAGVAGLVAAILAIVGLLISLAGLVVLVGPEAAGASASGVELSYAEPWASDLFTILVAGMSAGGLAAIAAIVGSLVQVPVLPNLVPLACFVLAAWFESLLPAPMSEIARAASVQPGVSVGVPALDVALPALVWPVVAVVLVALVGPRQESLWRR